jgi:hypothetical protein
MLLEKVLIDGKSGIAIFFAENNAYKIEESNIDNVILINASKIFNFLNMSVEISEFNNITLSEAKIILQKFTEQFEALFLSEYLINLENINNKNSLKKVLNEYLRNEETKKFVHKRLIEKKLFIPFLENMKQF